jgi:phosphatidylserine decarboxylase
VLQAKGFAYSLAELLADPTLAAHYEGGQYVTLRLTSSMYHRFHAPADCRMEQVDYIAGDAWNVNPIALKRVERLYCKNERAVLRCRLLSGSASGALLTLVPVAAILVASIRLKFLDVRLHLRYRGPNVISCDATLQRGEEMGWFDHGSTIIMLVPAGLRLEEGISQGARVKVGQALIRVG